MPRRVLDNEPPTQATGVQAGSAAWRNHSSWPAPPPAASPRRRRAPHLKTVCDFGADVAMLAETKLTGGAQKAVSASLAPKYSCSFGPPVTQRRCRKKKRQSIWDGQAGGVPMREDRLALARQDPGSLRRDEVEPIEELAEVLVDAVLQLRKLAREVRVQVVELRLEGKGAVISNLLEVSKSGPRITRIFHRGRGVDLESFSCVRHLGTLEKRRC